MAVRMDAAMLPLSAVPVIATAALLGGCLLVLGLFLNLPQGQRRPYRYPFGLLLAGIALAAPPCVYASDTQPYGLILAYMSCGVAWTLLYWKFAAPASSTPTVLEVLSSYIAHSAYGVCKAHARFQRSQQHDAQPSHAAAPAGAALQEAPTANNTGRGVAQGDGWGVTLVRAAGTLLGVSLVYDVVFSMLCRVSPHWCNPATSSAPAFSTIHSAVAAAAGKGAVRCAGARLAAYLQLCLRGFLPFALLILGIDVGYCWVKLAVCMAAVVIPKLRLFARQLPAHALQRPWAAPNLRDYWGLRWQQFGRFHFEHLGYPAVDRLLPPAAPRVLRAMLHTAAAFFMTALTHEYMNWAAFGVYSGCYVAFFLVHCMAVLLEGCAAFVAGPALHRVPPGSHAKDEGGTTGSPGSVPSASTARKAATRSLVSFKLLGHVWVWVVLVLASPLFFEPMRAGGFYSSGAYHPFGAPLTPRLLSWLGAQEYGQLAFASDWVEAALPVQQE